ncbi:N-acetylmuramoyl-L-alanine amidase [Evansella sp. AB-rgal1]|uniref:N-acetylmuramoyl-L-alanine amidase n=1 Tax=Evansella sp. AB-rgal1 TaxID=3242696 RepID=UPI00359EF9E4
MKKFIFLLFILSFIGCSSISEEEEPMEVETMAELQEEVLNITITENLLSLENSEERSENITHVVIHFMNNASRNQQDPFNLKEIHSIFMEYGVSAHYVIDRDGEIIQLVEEGRVAYHAGAGFLFDYPLYENSLNAYSIGIELLAIGTEEEMLPVMTSEAYQTIHPEFIGYTEEQYVSLNNLLEVLYVRYPDIKQDRRHIIGHDEYAPGRKQDPGSLFDWTKIGFSE